MAREWRQVTLADLIEIKHGYAFPGEHIRDEPSNDILLTPGNFAVGGGFKSGKLKYFAGEVPSDYVLEHGDLLVTMTDLSKQSDTLGYPALVPSLENVRFLHNQRIGKVIIRPAAEVDKRFLYYVLHTKEYRDEVLASATGTTVKHTSPTRILSHQVLLPSLHDQGAIAHILGTLDDKIELNRRMNETLEEMARALFKSWFVDFDPVRAKAEGRDPGLPADVAVLFPDSFEDSEWGEIPRGWEIRGLDEIARFLNGLAMQKYRPTDEHSLPVIKIAQLRAGHTAGADKATTDLDPDYIVEDGDVLFSWSGSLECVLWGGGRGALNQHLFKVTTSEFPKWFYYLWIHKHLADFRQIAAGKATTMGHIQRRHLTDAKVVLPSPELLQTANKHLTPLIDAIPQHLVQSRTLAETRDALLPKLISGEVRVSNVPNTVREVQ